ncbi:LAMI_0H19812g1_1 [Lachancea mirantina]|uniref:Glycogen debranching enzyme n=1 Tax=Lachancea mirantina TaxID=1230905 RepID=A0A1G4KK75_9SACH|nr:LAMI_0H19812g1_1 [Lachancea mirantina]
MRELLLRLSESGEPIVSCSYGKGVLTLPSLPPCKDQKNSDPSFRVYLVIAGGSPVTRDGLVWTNCPPTSDTPFARDKFYKKRINASFQRDDHVALDIFAPGSYCFYLSYCNDNDELETTRRFYFVVPPTLTIGDRFLQLNAIAMETVVSKWMGKDWDRVFEKVASKGYNMVHFTPLQQRGSSNSPYSIYDQLQFDTHFFKKPEDVGQMIERLHEKFKMLALTDVVFNHTADNSPWLRDHPEAGYNHKTAPHLTAAIELDQALLDFSSKMKQLGYPTTLRSTQDLIRVMEGVKVHVLGSLRLWEYYVVDVEAALAAVESHWESASHEEIDVPQEIKENPVQLASFVREKTGEEGFGTLGDRFSNKLQISKFISILKSVYGLNFDKDMSSQVETILNEINLPLYREYDEDVREILEQLYNRIKYLRIDEHGPSLGEVNNDSPLTEPYFTRFKAKDGEAYALANNGWIWNGNPLVDFASSKSRAYLRREVIVWGDCVKLRYGSGPDDSRYLWDRMSKYIEMTAKLFDGFRIDNCHSTPLHVGEYFLDLARKHNPNLYVVAELFSGSESMDCLFVERLAISSLIREAMQAWSEEELSRLVHRHGGRPIGSYKFLPLDDFAYPMSDELSVTDSKADDQTLKHASEIRIPKILTAVPPHALFMDCTHDNETPFQKRTVEDALPNAALVSLCATAIGSVYGYDEMFPYLLDVVGESRTYAIKMDDGISPVKKRLYEIRDSMARENPDIEDSETHVHHEGQYITLQRSNARSGAGWFLIARTKFCEGGDQKLPKVILRGSRCELEMSYALKKVGDVIEDKWTIKGIPTELCEISGFRITYDEANGDSEIEIPQDFPQGSIAVFSTQQNGMDPGLSHFFRTGALKATEKLDLYSLNAALFRCDGEEKDVSSGKFGTYNIPKYGTLTFCGLQGWVTVLRNVIFLNDLAHPISDHLREGYWALDYLVNRLDSYKEYPGIQELQDWLASRFEKIKQLPYYLAPSFFALVVGIAYESCRYRALQQMSENVGSSTKFVQSLAMTSVQMVSVMSSTSLVPESNVPCMAAGLPHFSSEYMRCWGRDVFIALRGLLLATGRYEDAKKHILAFARTLKHGLIPNLLDAGRNPRYNARDAAWFFLQSIQDYVEIVPNGEEILKEKVSRRFPLDDTYVSVDDPRAFAYESTIEEIIHEIFKRHAKGIKYREANAGPNLDRVMKDEGFNIEISVDWETGFIHGGSQLNCGTWMDKMGESEMAGSSGIPGTPRDGAAIEIIGLLKSALRFVIKLQGQNRFGFTELEKSDGLKITYKEWESLVLKSFEKKFYIPQNSDDDESFDVDPSIINRRGIYKDLFRTGKPYEDYQLRPNFAIAMTVAPELFTPELALGALRIADENIRGPIGMRTLDPSDYNYRPYYRNGVDSTDFATAKGRNYHQGPEWVWCYGYFLRAFHIFQFKADAKARTRDGSRPSTYLYQQLHNRLAGHISWIDKSPWAGLTELTNKDGELCDDSSPTQAWSSGCLLDLFYDLSSSYDN